MRSDPDHATRARYERGCRCAKCKRANADYQRSYRDRTQPTIRHHGGITWEEHQLWN